MSIGARILALRRGRGWTQWELATECGVVRWTVGRWETEAARPDLPSLCRLADAFETTLDYLIRGRA